eukprot:1194161-Prorocentrum_minimum.AAC.6
MPNPGPVTHIMRSYSTMGSSSMTRLSTSSGSAPNTINAAMIAPTDVPAATLSGLWLFPPKNNG